MHGPVLGMTVSFNGKSNGAVGGGGISIQYGFLSVFSRNPWRQLCSFTRVESSKMCDFEFDISWSFRGQCNGEVGLPIYDFVLVTNNCNHM